MPFRRLRCPQHPPAIYIVMRKPGPTFPASRLWERKNFLPGVPSGPFGKTIAIGRRSRHRRPRLSSALFRVEKKRAKTPLSPSSDLKGLLFHCPRRRSPSGRGDWLDLWCRFLHRSCPTPSKRERNNGQTGPIGADLIKIWRKNPEPAPPTHSLPFSC